MELLKRIFRGKVREASKITRDARIMGPEELYHPGFNYIEGIREKVDNRNVMADVAVHLPADAVQISDTLDAHIKPELEGRKRRARREEFDSVLEAKRSDDDGGEARVPRTFTASNEADVSLRYEFFHAKVAKRTDHQSEGLAGSLFGVRTTVFHVLMVSNAAAAWRRFAVSVRTYDEFLWLSNHLKKWYNPLAKPTWPEMKEYSPLVDDDYRAAVIEFFLGQVVRIPMFHTSTAMPLLLYTNWPVQEIEKYLKKKQKTRRKLEELIPTERQEYESEVLQRDLTEAEVFGYSSVNANGGGEFGLDVIAAMDDADNSDVTFFNDLMSPPGADGGRGRRDDGESEEDQDATDAVTPAPGLAVTRGFAIGPPLAANINPASPCEAFTGARRKVTGSCTAIVGRNGDTLVTEEERHSVHVLGSFLDVGSVESVRHTPEGAIEVYRSSESLSGQCPDGDACRAGQAVRQEKERVRARVMRDLRSRRNKSSDDLATLHMAALRRSSAIAASSSATTAVNIACSLPAALPNLPNLPPPSVVVSVCSSKGSSARSQIPLLPEIPEEHLDRPLVKTTDVKSIF